MSISYEVAGEENPSREDMEDTVYKLYKRIDQYSTEANVYMEGSNRISIEIPGVTDAKEILESLKAPGILYFIRATDPDDNLNYQAKLNESGVQEYTEEGKAVYELTKPIEQIVEEGSVVVSGADVVSSEVKTYTDSYNIPQNIVSLQFSGEGAERFADATGEAAGKSGLRGTIAIYYDGELISVPSVNERIEGGQAQISGMRDYNEAELLAQNIRIGGLKLELQELHLDVVAPKFGGVAIYFIMSAVALCLMLILICIFFRVPGIAGAISLLLFTEIYCVVVMIFMNIFEIRVTPDHIVGGILSICINIVIILIEQIHIKNEINTGKAVMDSIHDGFSIAIRIVIGTMVAMFAAIVLVFMAGIFWRRAVNFAFMLAVDIPVLAFTIMWPMILMYLFYAAGFKSPGLYGMRKMNK